MAQTDRENTEQTQPSALPEGPFARLARVALVALPVSTVVVIALAIFVVGAPRSYRAARVWGGPTVAQEALSLRVYVFDRYGEVERPVPSAALQLRVGYGSKTVVWRGTSDAEGNAYPEVDLATGRDGKVRMELEQRGFSLVRGTAHLTLEAWQRGVERRGGWTRARAAGPFAIRVRPGRGTFAVPFADLLLIQVRDSQGPVAGAELSLRPEGGEISPPGERVLTDDRGRAQVLFSPSEHHPTLGIEVSADGRLGRWHSTLPVVAGAMHARLAENRLLLRSPIVRERAYFSVVTERGRLLGGSVRLSPDGRGGARAEVGFPSHLTGPSWAVVSSEPDLRAPATVGWPLRFPADGARSFDAYDRLLLDGAPAGYEANQRVYRQARWLAGGYAALALALVVVLLLWRVRSADERLARHLKSEGSPGERPAAAQRVGFALVVAVLCVSLGFLLVLLLALYRIGAP